MNEYVFEVRRRNGAEIYVYRIEVWARNYAEALPLAKTEAVGGYISLRLIETNSINTSAPAAK